MIGPRPFAMVMCAVVCTACGDAEARPDSGVPAGFARVSEAGMLGTLSVIDSVEIQAARLAGAKAADTEVRAFAARIARDHEMLQRSLDSLARAMRVSVEPTTDAVAIRARAQSLLETLDALSGRDFDLTYAAAQVDDHQMALQTLDAWQHSAKDAWMRAVLRATRPTVQAHYDHALALVSRLTPHGESSVWKKHLGVPGSATGKP